MAVLRDVVLAAEFRPRPGPAQREEEKQVGARRKRNAALVLQRNKSLFGGHNKAETTKQQATT